MENIERQRKQDYLRLTKRARHVQTVFFLLVLVVFLFLADDLNLSEPSMHYFLLVPVLAYQWVVRFLKYRYLAKQFDRTDVWDHLGLPYVLITLSELLIVVVAQFLIPYVPRPTLIGPALVFLLSVLSLDRLVDSRIKRLDPTHLSERELIEAEREARRVKY
ncbi:hypothetical protein QK289_04995 [Exiguobacterium antarcticum]|uniref:Uncharacterized protein n=1 Tax=Exiguobacterium antarcticum TaxID=132920 RepID=A0ABT6R088_9BACL|nr:hypothetical protein [Exiguobacterium antarcticum]MDI3234353.1 hypothetical protein [Exiguobacterium antarcticum]